MPLARAARLSCAVLVAGGSLLVPIGGGGAVASAPTGTPPAPAAPAPAAPAPAAPAPAAPAAAEHAEQVQQLIVKYRPGAVRPAARTATPVGGRVRALPLPRPLDLPAAQALAARIAADPAVEYAEPDRHVLAASTTAPDDPLLPEQWTLTGDWGVRPSGAWARTRGRGVVVAVLDTGVVAHPDLHGQTVPGWDMVSSRRTARDGDGRDADPADPGDAAPPYGVSSWHGTHVSGIVAAAADDGRGTPGSLRSPGSSRCACSVPVAARSATSRPASAGPPACASRACRPTARRPGSSTSRSASRRRPARRRSRSRSAPRGRRG